MFRYMAFVWNAQIQSQNEASRLLSGRLQSSAPDWTTVLTAPGMGVFCAGIRAAADQTHSLTRDAGVILGTLFERRESSSQAAHRTPGFDLSADESERVLASNGRRLISHYWGSYVAFLSDPSSARKCIIRDPLAALPCFQTKFCNVSVFFSNIADCLKLDLLHFTVNWENITSRVVAAPYFAADTALNEVREIYGGQCVELTPDREIRLTLWNPLPLTRSDSIEDPVEAARALYASVTACTHAWASHHRSLLVRLSGGLDSSIVLSCLGNAEPHPKITCLTYYVPEGNADERPWARLAANRTRCRQVEQPRRRNVQFQDILRFAPAVNPTPYIASLELSAVEKQLALEADATAMFSGVGGDYLFGATESTKHLAPLDYARRHGLRAPLLKVAESAAVLLNTSIWSLLAFAVARRRRSGVGLAFYKAHTGRYTLSNDSLYDSIVARGRMAHPWYLETNDAPPGHTPLILNIARPPLYYDPLGSAEDLQVDEIAPLLSQPVVEVCLRTPSYLQVYEGQDRAIARRAFKDDVPQEIIRREWKDRAPGFAETLLQSNREFARALLLNGSLAKRGLLDRHKVDLALSEGPTNSAAQVSEIFDHLCTEAWLRHWIDYSQPPSRNSL